MKLPRFSVALLLIAVSSASRADIYGYVDAQGVSHFSAEKLDANYKLWSKSTLGSVGLEPADRQNGPQPARFTQHPNLKKYEPLLQQASRDFSVELHLLKAVMAAESGFNPDAISPKGAIGLMQVMPATAQRFGLLGDKKKSLEQKLRDPKTNIRLGARYLSELAKMFPGQRDLVIASYNAGEGAVRQYKNAIPPYAETRNYVQLVSELYQVYQPKLAANKGRAMALRDVAAGGKRLRLTISAPPRPVEPQPTLPADS